MPAVQKAETQLDDALSTLARRGGPVAVTRGGRTVAVLMKPEELERMEDERDAAILREAKLRDRDEKMISLEDLATDLGVDLDRLRVEHPRGSFTEERG